MYVIDEETWKWKLYEPGDFNANQDRKYCLVSMEYALYSKDTYRKIRTRFFIDYFV